MLHLVTQRGQPYASVRKCCEMCGTACGPYWPGDQRDLWTDDPKDYEQAENNCLKTPALPPAAWIRDGVMTLEQMTAADRLAHGTTTVAAPIEPDEPEEDHDGESGSQTH